MKKNIVYSFSAMFSVAIFAFSGNNNYQVSEKTDDVSRFEGLLIFFASEPATDYEYLGTCKLRITWDDEPETHIRYYSYLFYAKKLGGRNLDYGCKY